METQDSRNQLICDMLYALDPLIDPKNRMQVEHIVRRLLSEVRIEKSCTSLSTDVDNSEHLIRLFLATKRVEGRSDQTLTQYTYSLKRLLTAVDKPVLQIDRNDIRLWVCDLSTKMSQVSVRNQLANVRPFFEWLRDEEYIVHNPCSGVAHIKTPPKEIVTLSEEDMIKMEEVARNSLEKAFIACLFSTGLRCGEITNLKRSNLDLQNKVIHLISEKSRKPRVVPLTARSAKSIADYLDSRTDSSEYLFVSRYRAKGKDGKFYFHPMSNDSAERMVKLIGQRANVSVPKVTIHVFRKTLGTNLLNSGCPIEVIQAILGHASPETTLSYYAKISTDSVKRAFDRHIHTV